MSSSSATVRVEKATSDLLIGPDWTMNIDICDSVNSDHWQAKDVVKAVKKRLQNKNPRVQLLALTLLESMIKNCGDYVHLQVVERNILQEMIKIVRKKTDMNVRDKILVLLDSWQAAFGGPGGKYPQYYWAYDELRRSGIEFPQRPADAAIIFGPPATHPTARHFQAGYGMPSGTTRRLDEAMASEMESLSLSNLASIRSVMELLTDMLQAVNPNDREAVKDEVIVDLVSQCRANQKKLMHLVTSTGDEELLAQGLALNDDLQSVLAKHDAIASGSPLPTEAIDCSPQPNPPVAPVATPSGQLEEAEDEEDDDFAQLARRRSKTKSVPPQSTSTETADQSASLNTTAITTTTTTTTGSPTASTSTASSALALPDPPTPVRTSTKEQDMIDLLSITLSTTNSSSPHTPLTPPNASNLSPHQIPVSPNAQVYPPYSPQSYPINQGQIPYNSYVVPWAQPQQQPQMPQYSSSYPPPPWAGSTNSNQVPMSATPYPYQTTHANSSSPYRPPARPMQHYNSFGSRGNNVGETQVSSNSNAGPSTGHKPFVPSYRLFEDLIDLRNADGGLKTSNPSTSMSGSSGQGMVGGRK